MENQNGNIKLGDIAPSFTADTTLGQVKLSDYRGKWLILFSYVRNFSPVCYTELISFARFNPEFSRRNAYLLALSNDSTASTLAWDYNIYRSSGIQIPFPIISDTDRTISSTYGMFNSSNTELTRSTYIIDPEQKIRVIMQYPDSVGRNISEILRLIDALQISDRANVLTPANWIPSQPVIRRQPQTYDELVDSFKTSNNGNYVDWYLCYCSPNQTIPNLDNVNQLSENANVEDYTNFNFEDQNRKYIRNNVNKK